MGAEQAGEMVRVIAYLDHPIIARAVFRAAVEQYPKVRIRHAHRGIWRHVGRASRSEPIYRKARNLIER